jgi:hypothetical protein
MWFNEVLHQLGPTETLIIEQEVSEQLEPMVTKRIGGVLANVKLASLIEMPRSKLIELTDALCVNWLSGDGVWFQAVENRHNMYIAKLCNDTCWARFSPLEANVIMSFLGLPQQSGLEGLRRALEFRLYTRINKHSAEITKNCLIFHMDMCRVQDARKRKGLPDYPCKSAGVVEYSTFAASIDSRIKTDCIGCPPDPHPQGWSCAWRFTI